MQRTRALLQVQPAAPHVHARPIQLQDFNHGLNPMAQPHPHTDRASLKSCSWHSNNTPIQTRTTNS